MFKERPVALICIFLAAAFLIPDYVEVLKGGSTHVSIWTDLMGNFLGGVGLYFRGLVILKNHPTLGRQIFAWIFLSCCAFFFINGTFLMALRVGGPEGFILGGAALFSLLGFVRGLYLGLR
jgi:hypothetical protein